MISSIDRPEHSSTFPNESVADASWSAALDALGAAVGHPGPPPPGLPGGDWRRDIEGVLAARGFVVRWVTGSAAALAPLARPDLPLLTRDDHGELWFLDERWFTRTRVRRLGDPTGRRWRSTRALRRALGDEERTWALIEPLLPASSMSDPEHALSPARRLWRLVRTERADVGVIAMWAAVSGAFALAAPIAMQVVINWLAFGGLVQPLLVLGGVLLACLSLGAAAALLQRLSLETLERRLFVRIVADLAARLPRARLAAFDGVNQVDLANRFFDVLTLQKAASTLMLDGIGAALQFAVAIALLGMYHPWLLLFDVLLLGGIAAVLGPWFGRAVDTAIVESKRKYQVAALIEELAHDPLAFRLGGANALAERRADETVRTWLMARAAHFRVFFRQVIGAHTLQVVASTGLLVGSGALVLAGELTLGQLVAAEFAVTVALAGLVKFTDKLGTVYDLLAGIDKLGALLDLVPETWSGAGHPPTGTPARVVLREAAAGELAPVSLELPAGGRTAVLVEGGTGQRVLAELVCGVRAPERGRVEIDDLPAERWRPDARLGQTLLLCSDTVLRGTLRENLALGRPVEDDVLWAALRAVGLQDRVHALRKGLDAEIRTTGAPLIRPELRALLVARALVVRPRLLVVDGWLDGLGERLREHLMALLSSPDAPWTLLVLTADPTLAAQADVRIVLPDPTATRGSVA